MFALLNSALDLVASVASLSNHFDPSEIKLPTQRTATSTFPGAALDNLGKRRNFNSVGKRDHFPVVRGKTNIVLDKR